MVDELAQGSGPIAEHSVIECVPHDEHSQDGNLSYGAQMQDATTATGRDAEFDAWLWRPSVSAPFVSRTVTLRSIFAQKALRTLFGRLQMASYGMSVTIPILERDQGTTGDILERHFVAALERVLSMQAKTRERCRHWLGANTMLQGVHYEARGFEIEVFTPNANHALSLFIGLDETITMIDELWYAGVLSASQAKRAVLEARSQVKNFVNEMDGLCRRSKAQVRRAQASASSAPMDEVHTALEEAVSDRL